MPAASRWSSASRCPSWCAPTSATTSTGFLAESGLTRADVGWWVAHPGGPKVLDALAGALDVPPEALGVTWASLDRIGNLSSASVLHVLADTLRDQPPAPGSHGVLMAMGPGFCLETVLLRAPGHADGTPERGRG